MSTSALGVGILVGMFCAHSQLGPLGYWGRLGWILAWPHTLPDFWPSIMFLAYTCLLVSLSALPDRPTTASRLWRFLLWLIAVAVSVAWALMGGLLLFVRYGD